MNPQPQVSSALTCPHCDFCAKGRSGYEVHLRYCRRKQIVLGGSSVGAAPLSSPPQHVEHPDSVQDEPSSESNTDVEPTVFDAIVEGVVEVQDGAASVDSLSTDDESSSSCSDSTSNKKEEDSKGGSSSSTPTVSPPNEYSDYMFYKSQAKALFSQFRDEQEANLSGKTEATRPPLQQNRDTPDCSLNDGDSVDSHDSTMTNEQEEADFFSAEKYPLQDQLDGYFTAEIALSIKLLKILHKLNAPLFAYNDIMQVFCDANEAKHYITSRFPRRKKVIRKLFKRFSMEKMLPRLVSIPSTMPRDDGKEYEMVCHDPESIIISLLTDPRLNNDDNNYLFSNPDNPLDRAVLNPDILGDLPTGRAFYYAEKCVCTEPNHLICSLLLYLDGLYVDRHGRLRLEPLYVALGIYKRHIRNKPEAWRPLGYIHTPHFSKAEQKHRQTKDKLQLFHNMLKAILEPLADLQKKGIPWTLNYRGKSYNVILNIPVIVILGDTEMHDKLCGRYLARNFGVSGLCRHCQCPFAESDNVNYDIESNYTYPDVITELIRNQDKVGLRGMSQHPIDNVFYTSGICVGGNARNVHGMTPAELVHVWLLGLVQYTIEGYFVVLGYNLGKKGSHAPVVVSHIDELSREIGRLLKHQSDRELPRTYFPNGVSGGTKMAAHEYLAVLLVLLLVSCSTQGRELILQKTNNPDLLNQWIELLQLMVSFTMWMKEETHTHHEVLKAHEGIKLFLEKLKTTVNRQNGNGFKLSKFHLLLHICEYLLDFGVHSNIDTNCPESNHKENAKYPALGTQRRYDCFDFQTAMRYLEYLVVSVSYEILLQSMGRTAKRKFVEEILPMEEEESSLPPSPVIDNVRSTSHFTATCEEACYTEFQFQFQWKNPKCSLSFPKRVTDFVNEYVVANLHGQTVLGFTELRLNGYLFRAHPSYRSGDPWHDWAMLNWGADIGDMPGQILCFLDLRQIEFDDDHIILELDNGQPAIKEPDIYMVVQSLQEYFNPVVPTLSMVRKGSTVLRKFDRNGVRIFGTEPGKLYLVPLDCIQEPVTVIPDMGGPPTDFIVLTSQVNWPQVFRDYIEA